MTEQTASSVQLNSEKFIRDEPSLTNAELEFIRIFVNYTRNKVLDAAGIRRKPEFPSGPVLEQLNYLSDMYHRPENLQAIEEGLLIIYKKFISNCFPNPPVDRTLDFQTLQSLLEMSLYYQGTKHRSFSFDIRDFQELDELIKNLLESYQWALIKVYDLDSCNLSRIESFQKFLKSFCANYIEETIKSFDRDCSLLEKNKQPMTSDQDLDEFDNRINSVLEKLRGCQNQRFSEKDKEELSRYLEKGLKFKGLYGKGEPFQCSSGESITAEEFQKQFKSLSEDNTQAEALRIKALAYSDLYKKCFKDYARELGFITQDKITNTTTTKSNSNLIAYTRNINLEKQLIPALVKQFRQSN
jgi:hypothetical protein